MVFWQDFDSWSAHLAHWPSPVIVISFSLPNAVELNPIVSAMTATAGISLFVIRILSLCSLHKLRRLLSKDNRCSAEPISVTSAGSSVNCLSPHAPALLCGSPSQSGLLASAGFGLIAMTAFLSLLFHVSMSLPLTMIF